ncbi:MAG: RNA polymerase sigma-70 factor [Bacteroidota bacterium]
MVIDENKLSTLYPLLKAKDEDAIKEFFLIMQPHIFYFLYRFTSKREIAEDLTQETFVKFWLSLDSLDPSRSCKSYLYKIARNLALNYIERNPVQTTIGNDESLLVRLSSITQEDLDATFFMDDFQKAINTLPERCKATFLLSRFSGFNYSEIAEVLGVSIHTVKNQMNKALAVLRKRLRNYLD